MRTLLFVPALIFASPTAPFAAEEGATGLQKPFPALRLPADNPVTAEKVELGRLLFFDRILSGDHQNSCAHCHHPDLGFADGLPRARGWAANGTGAARHGGVELLRNAPTLWNAAYSERFFWDGRAGSLEEQARGPITNMEEMGKPPGRIVGDLEATPEYATLFARAFPGEKSSPVTFDNVVRAIASFERTLVSRDSRFDRYAAGDAQALRPEERRGLKLFLSTETRCSECHELPTFSTSDFHVIGVPDAPDAAPDEPHPEAEPGRGGGPRGAFKVPTLRNIARTAPYMHNGIFKTLDEVVDFYRDGGGRGRGLTVPLQDERIRKFELTAEEKADLAAFLGALTDESAAPSIPQRVPSALPVVARADASGRASPASLTPEPAPEVRERPAAVEVHPGESIESAVERAGRGGTVLVHPGVYHESILVVHHGVTIAAVHRGGERPVIDGRGRLKDGILALGNRFALEGIALRGFRGNAVAARGARRVAFRDLTIEEPGLYGIYPVSCQEVSVDRCRVSGARDAGIYVGQSEDVLVVDCEVSGNVVGIEIENSRAARVFHNHAHDNTGGILVVLLPFLPSKAAEATRVIGNRVVNNNKPNFADPGAMVASVRQGTGILVIAADRTEVAGNEIRGNGTYGVAVASLRGLYPQSFLPGGTRLDVEPDPDGNRVHGNRLSENGRDPDPRHLKESFPGCDLLWDGSGRENGWHEEGATAFPGTLPALPAGSAR